MNQNKKRYSVPAKLIELLFTDDSFLNEVIKTKKTLAEKRFPRMDQWAGNGGFNMKFALAGYSPDNVKVIVEGNTIHVRSDGLENERYVPPSPSSEDDAFKEYNKDPNSEVYMGYVSRGIARRSFEIGYVISEEFDVSKTEAHMQDGLLHIFIPNSNVEDLGEVKVIKINRERKS